MNINDNQYTALLSIAANVIELDKSNGVELTFEKIRTYISTACVMTGMHLDEEAYRRLENDIEYQYHIRHTEEGVIRNDYEDVDEWYANDRIEDPYFWRRYRRYLVD